MRNTLTLLGTVLCQDVLQAWQDAGNVRAWPPNSLYNVWLRDPLLKSVLCQHWVSVAVRHECWAFRSEVGKQYFNCPGRLGEPGEADAPAHSIFDASMFRHAAALIRYPDVVDEENLGPSKLDVLAWLDAIGDVASLGPEPLLEFSRTGGGIRGQKYKIDALIEVMLLASLLRDSNETKKAIKRSLAVMFPHDPTYVDRVLKQDFSVPSASTISRFRLAIDVSYARAISMYIRNLLNETRPFAIYFLCDSSPRGGRDWLLSEYWLVSGPNIEKVVELQNEIIALRKLLAEGSEEDVDSEIVASIAERSQELQRLMWHHVLIPVALGVGFQGVHQQFVALLHALRVEADCWELVQSFCKSVVGMTTDFGVESYLQQVPRVDANELFYHWREGTELIDDVPEALPSRGSRPSRDAWISFEQSLPVSGIMHVIHNCLTDIGTALPDYDEWLVKAKAVSRFMSHREYKELLVEHCFSSPSTMVHRDSMLTFNAQIYDERFESLMSFLVQALPLRAPLQMYFDRARFQHVVSEYIDLDVVGSSLTSHAWWGYSSVVFACGAIPHEVQCWLSGCECHPPAKFTESSVSSYYLRREAFRREVGVEAPCPLKGCWAHALAAGDVEIMVHKAVQTYSSLLLTELVNLNAATRAYLLLNWERGNGHCIYILTLKFGTWRVLPWICCGIGHVDPERGRGVAREARRQWISTPQDRRDHHEHLTKARIVFLFFCF